MVKTTKGWKLQRAVTDHVLKEPKMTIHDANENDMLIILDQ